MSLIDRLSNAFTATKKAWFDPLLEKRKDNSAAGEANAAAAATAVPPSAGPGSNAYYVDTISKAQSDLPKINAGANAGTLIGSLTVTNDKGRLETKLDLISAKINAELSQDDSDFDKLQTMIYQVVMMMMRLAAKNDHENIQELNLKIKKQAQEIQSTYNTWQGLTVTVISAGVSVAGGVAGLSPFMPSALISTESAKLLLSASQGIGSAGTGLSGIGSIFNNRSEGNRQVYQIHLKRLQDTEEERKGSKHTKGDHLKTAKAALEEFLRMKHEAHKAATGGQ